VVERVCSRASHDQLAHFRVAVGSHHEEIGVPLAGLLDDDLAGVAFTLHELRLNTVGLEVGPGIPKVPFRFLAAHDEHLERGLPVGAHSSSHAQRAPGMVRAIVGHQKTPRAKRAPPGDQHRQLRAAHHGLGGRSEQSAQPLGVLTPPPHDDQVAPFPLLGNSPFHQTCDLAHLTGNTGIRAHLLELLERVLAPFVQ